MDPVLLADSLSEGDALTTLQGMGLTDVNALAAKFLSDRKFIDSSIRIPSEGATAEDREKYYKALGRPATAEEYSLPESSDEGLAAVLKAIAPVAYEQGMSNDQLSAIAAAAMKQNSLYQGEVAEMIQGASADWAAQAKAQHGDNYETIVATGKRMLDEQSEKDPALKKILQLTGMGNHPALIEAFARLGSQSGDTSPATLEGGTVTEQPLDEAKKLARENVILASTDKYKKKSHPEHNVALDDFYKNTKRLVELGFQGCTDERLKEEYAFE